MGDSFRLEGFLRIYEIGSDEAQHELSKHWHTFTLAEKAKEARLAVEARNLITSAGRTLLLSYVGTSGATNAWAKYYAVGTGAIYVVQPSDTQLASELFRAVPASFSVVGNGVTITTNFTSGQAVGTYTEAGLFGGTASGTVNSGTLCTHLLYSYTKGSTAIFSDYLVSAT